MINADNAELAKFNELAQQWWDPAGKFKPLHDINPLRMAYITERISLSDTLVADIGCGGGLLSESLSQAGAQVVGIDLAPGPLAVAQLHQQSTKTHVQYRQMSVEALAEEMPERFDLVTCMEMLEHVPDPASVVQACATLLKPGGMVFFSTLNRTPKAYLLAIVGAEYILNMLPRGTHDYQKFIRPSELDAWMGTANLHLTDITGLHYNPLLRTYRLGPGVSVNYMVCGIRA